MSRSNRSKPVWTVTRVSQLIACGIRTGLNIIMIECLKTALMFIAFKLDSNVIVIGAFSDPLWDNVIQPAFKPSVIKPFGNFKFEALKSSIRTAYDHDCNWSILELDSWSALMISFSKGFAIEAFCLVLLNCVKLPRLNAIWSKLWTGSILHFEPNSKQPT